MGWDTRKEQAARMYDSDDLFDGARYMPSGDLCPVRGIWLMSDPFVWVTSAVAVATLLLGCCAFAGETTRLDAPMHPKLVNAIARVQVLNDQRDYAASIDVLSEILELADATPTDLAITRETLAGAYERKGDLGAARQSLIAVTEEPGSLAKVSVDRIWLKRASLSYRVGDYRDAITSVETWHQRVTEPSPISYQILALSYLGEGERGEAMRYAQKSADMSQKAGNIPPASIRQLLGKVAP